MIAKANYRENGFTLLELMVVITIVGIIAALAAPSWLSFLTRQSLNSARADLLGVLSSAQKEAKSLQKSRKVEFSTSDLSVVVMDESSTTGTKISLGNDAASKNFRITAPSSSIVFNYDGSVEAGDLSSIKIESNDSSAQSCVIVTTILGGLKPASDETCDSFFSTY